MKKLALMLFAAVPVLASAPGFSNPQTNPPKFYKPISCTSIPKSNCSPEAHYKLTGSTSRGTLYKKGASYLNKMHVDGTMVIPSKAYAHGNLCKILFGHSTPVRLGSVMMTEKGSMASNGSTLKLIREVKISPKDVDCGEQSKLHGSYTETVNYNNTQF